MNNEFQSPRNVPLKEYVESLIHALRTEFTNLNHALRQEVDIKFEAARISVNKAETEMNRRLEGMNEMRAQLDKQAGIFVTKEYLEAVLRDRDKRVDDLSKQMGILVNQFASDKGKIYGAFGVLAVLFSIIQLAVWYLK